MMRAVALLAVLIGVAFASPAQATLVYARLDAAGNSQIFVAHDDGSAARVLTAGGGPVISPNGREVAYFVPGGTFRGGVTSSLRVIGVHGGRSHVLARHVWSGVVGKLPFAWSPNSRYLLLPSTGDGAVIVDARRRTTRHVPVAVACQGQAGSASFSPDSTGVAIEGDCDYTGSVVFVRVDGSGRRVITSNGGNPVWGRRGLAFVTLSGNNGRSADVVKDNLLLLRRIGGHARVLLRRQNPDVLPIWWSANGRRLLAVRDMHPLLIAPSTRQVHTLAVQMSELDMLSRDGRFILGVMQGNLVSVRSDTGAVTVLAQGAVDGSWTR